MITYATPTARSCGSVPAGPVVTWSGLAAKAAALEVEVAIGNSFILVDGVAYSTLTTADAVLNTIADYRGIDLRPVAAVARGRAELARNAALVAADERLKARLGGNP